MGTSSCVLQDRTFVPFIFSEEGAAVHEGAQVCRSPGLSVLQNGAFALGQNGAFALGQNGAIL